VLTGSQSIDWQLVMALTGSWLLTIVLTGSQSIDWQLVTNHSVDWQSEH